MGNVAFSLGEVFESCGACCTCGVTVVVPQDFKRKRLEDHKTYYCPNGHPLHYPGESELEKTKRLLETERRWREQEIESRKKAWEAADRASRRASAAKGQVTRIKNRVGNGVCPCCKRTFQNLLRHMHTKHPDFKNEAG